MEYKCSVCQEKVEGDLLLYINHTESHIIEHIKSKHPDWAEENGLCSKCEEYYRKQLKGEGL